jgi:Peptidase S24-like
MHVSPWLLEMEAPSEFTSTAGGYPITLMSTISAIRHANFLKLLARFPTVQAFANAIERSHSQVSQLKNQSPHSRSGEPRVIGDDIARHIEARLGLAMGWMDTPQVGERPGQWQTNPQNMEVLPVYNSPPVQWGDNLKNDLPATFSAALPDDAMAPRARRGDVVRFQRGLDPRPGDGVLVQDSAGRWYFRLYRERKPGEWEAHPINDAYQPLDAARDGLQLLAVLVGIEAQRWG